MIRTARICVVPIAVGEEFIVVDASNGGNQRRWDFRRVINTLPTKLPLQRITREVVILADEPKEDVVLGSSPNAEAFVRRMMPQLSDYEWQSKELDW